jgi:hypothetical protein
VRCTFSSALHLIESSSSALHLVESLNKQGKWNAPKKGNPLRKKSSGRTFLSALHLVESLSKQGKWNAPKKVQSTKRKSSAVHFLQCAALGFLAPIAPPEIPLPRSHRSAPLAHRFGVGVSAPYAPLRCVGRVCTLLQGQ